MSEHVPDLRERRRRETQLEITRAALELFETQGCAATTVDQIARRAGVSPSTFFRSFASKEESVLGLAPEFELDIDAWLASSAPEDITLTAIEALYERSVERFSAAPHEARDRLLRTRRLIGRDDHLRAAAFATEAMTLCRVTDSVAAKLGGHESRSYARLLIEGAGMAMRIAFDDWAERIDAGQDADLVDIYRTTLRDLRRVVAG
ncbi:TetR family transcriptional regulator [Rhodococcus sp. 05-340-1]|jgi:AcrR family transcriptional regulator|uniref:TetR/AcrR family transcriptional regulator n=1 Tax=unclassified Rhodococcus (in: high G+C Gram-positive bacteria) TaxID=192944 RepID=UPI000B9B6CD7|nr:MULTISPECIES: TetR/AcrR family transcriptional regulator [unclassified Rhodococcus (in: high G+C Gram-positive bacteria)]OZD68532.1 TetR family transcriptional regulator [Rhodococcus sp. 05-340-2]OZD70110.1 TetR family transcriptional regulator [Rhodococcus sp. 05-340-1]OZF40304.1 TetR family transcriptional regulator [Rhodococcus sp. 14-2483-1-2]